MDQIHIQKDPIKRDEKINKNNAAAMKQENKPRKPWWWRKLGG